MAEEALKKVEEQLECAICLGTYTDPKLLQCFHVYCRQCLVKLVVRDEQGQLILTCSTCRQITPIPANGVAGLQPAFHINELFDIIDNLKKAKDTAATMERAESFMPHPTPLKKATLSCSEHIGRELELYCETCEELICSHCALKGQKHHSHEYDLISSSFERYKGELTSSLEPLEKQLEAVNTSLAGLGVACGKLSDQRAAIEAIIHNTIRRLQEALDIRKTELVSQLHQITQSKLKRLATQRDQIETTQAQLNSCLNFVKESLKTDSHGEVLKIKTTIEKRVKELSGAFQPDTLKPITEAHVTFSTSSDIMSACQNYGQVFLSDSPDPSKCHIISKGLEIAEVSKRSTALLQVIDFRGEPCEEPIESLECELVSETRDVTVRGNVKRKGHSRYKISYQPTMKGRHKLHIKVNNQPIRGSPFTVRVKLPIKKLGTPMLTIGGLAGPWGVAVNQSGEMVITEMLRHCVSIFSPTGEKLWSFDTCGSAHGQFNSPRGVAVDSEGNILVVDNHHIQKFTSNGQFLTAVDTCGGRHLQFDYPQDIAFNLANNKVYVVGLGNRCVHVLNSDLTFSHTFGREGSGKGQFECPRGIACDSIGKVYVADTNNGCIKVFTAEGQFLRVFGKKGQGRGELSSPYGVAIDASGIVYVSEKDSHLVSLFNSEGQFLTSFGREESKPGEFKAPYGLAVDSSGVVYVCDYESSVVQLF